MIFLIRYSIIKRKGKNIVAASFILKLYKMDSLCYLDQLKQNQRRNYGCILKLIVSKVVTFMIIFPHGQISLIHKGYFHRQLVLKTTRNYRSK